jgi:hypothetical protein
MIPGSGMGIGPAATRMAMKRVVAAVMTAKRMVSAEGESVRVEGTPDES